jgi:hypothetical protein
MMALFSLPQVQAYTTEHLTEHAAHWTDLAQRRTDVFSAVKNDADNLNWTGVGDVAMKATIARDHGTATGEAATLTAAAQTARDAATVLDGQKRAIVNTVDQAIKNGFSVSPAWVVTDAQYPPGSAEWVARQSAAQGIQATLEEQVAAFTSQEYATGAALSGHAVTLGGSGVTTGVESGIRALDYTVVNPDGSESHIPDPPQAPILINQHGGQTPVPADPRDHNGSAREIIDAIGKIGVGVGAEVGGVAAAPATGGGSIFASIPGGAIPIYDGLDDLAHMTNMGRIPSAPPIAGQDGPG